MPDITKLPQWAQNRLQKLEADVQYWKDHATRVAAGNTRVCIRHHDLPPQHLPDTFPVSFTLVEKDTPLPNERRRATIDVVLGRGNDGRTVLQLYTSGSLLAVMPHAANVIHVTIP